MRLRISALALLCACSFSEEKAGVFVEVDNVPPQADGMVVTVTDSLSNTKTYKPAFQPQSLDGGVTTGCTLPNCLLLSLAPPAQIGTVTVKVDASQNNVTCVTGTVTGAYTGSDLQMQLTLGAPATGTCK
jgi:hypothetical protein